MMEDCKIITMAFWRFLSFLSIAYFQETAGLKDVSLVALPHNVVENGSTVSLFCRYNVQAEHLYMVTWFRGNHQVFRYLPSDKPPIKVFPTAGINVDETSSNSTTLVLKRVELQVSGKWSCEVTTEAPNFSTASSTIIITVIVLSRLDPILWINEKSQYKAGDLLSANCSSPPTRPPANITFYLNQQPLVNQQGKSRIKEKLQAAAGQPSLYKSWGWMETQLSQYQVRRGFLVLECVATVAGNHTKTTFRHLKATTSQPSPQRVRMTSGGVKTNNLLITCEVCFVIILLGWSYHLDL